MKASAEQASYGSEGLGTSAESESGQDWGETSQNAMEQDAESLTRARNAATPDPYGSPSYGA